MRRFLAVLAAVVCVSATATPATAPALPPTQFEEFNEIGDAFESMGTSSYSSRWRRHPDRYFQPLPGDGTGSAAEDRVGRLLDKLIERTSCSGGGILIDRPIGPQQWEFECPPGERVVTEIP